MKTTLAVCSAAMISFTVTFGAGAGIIAGPITNPANGHDYYLLTPNTWTASEAEAENLGGTLAIVRNAAEQEWVFNKFGSYRAINRNLWIGLHKQGPAGDFAWVTDERVDYVNWCLGEPNNAAGRETAAEMFETGNPWGHPPGTWNDSTDDGSSGGGPQPCGVVEVPGKAQEASVTREEKSVTGTWYNNGDPAQSCSIVAADQRLFAINQNLDASRVVYTPEGFLFFSKWRQHAEVVRDRILWSRGNWWSREPVKYKTAAAPWDTMEPETHSASTQ